MAHLRGRGPQLAWETEQPSEWQTTHPSPGQCVTNTWPPEPLVPGKDTKHTSNWSLCPCGESENLSALDLGSTRSTGPALDSASA